MSDERFRSLAFRAASGGEREDFEDHVRGEQGCDVRMIQSGQHLDDVGADKVQAGRLSQ